MVCSHSLRSRQFHGQRQWYSYTGRSWLHLESTKAIPKLWERTCVACFCKHILHENAGRPQRLHIDLCWRTNCPSPYVCDTEPGSAIIVWTLPDLNIRTRDVIHVDNAVAYIIAASTQEMLDQLPNHRQLSRRRPIKKNLALLRHRNWQWQYKCYRANNYC